MIRINSTTFQVATSQANAVAGNAIVLTTTGSGTMTVGLGTGIHPLGSYLGQEAHVQLISELASHNHATSPGTGFRVQVGSGGTLDATAGTQQVIETTTANTGGGGQFNILSPVLYVNYLIKL